MKVIAIGSIVKPMTPEQRQETMQKEVPLTLQRYLDGIIEQFWYRQDAPGVVFLMEVNSLEAAKQATSQHPIAAAGFATFEHIPVGPLAPLGMLIQGR